MAYNTFDDLYNQFYGGVVPQTGQATRRGPATFNRGPATAEGLSLEISTDGTVLNTLETRINPMIETAKLMAATGNVDGSRNLLGQVGDWIADNSDYLYQTNVEAHASDDQHVRAYGQSVFNVLYGGYLNQAVEIGVPDPVTGQVRPQSVPLSTLLDPKSNQLFSQFRKSALRGEGYGAKASELLADPERKYDYLASVRDMVTANGEMLTKPQATEAVANALGYLEDENTDTDTAITVANRIVQSVGTGASRRFASDVKSFSARTGLGIDEAADQWLGLYRRYYSQGETGAADGRGRRQEFTDSDGYTASSFGAVANALASVGMSGEALGMAVGKAGQTAKRLRDSGIMLPAPRQGDELRNFALDLKASVYSPDGTVSSPRSKTFSAMRYAELVGQSMMADPHDLDTDFVTAGGRGGDGKSPDLAYTRATASIASALTAAVASDLRDGGSRNTDDKIDELAGGIRRGLGMQEDGGSYFLSRLLARQAGLQMLNGKALNLRALINEISPGPDDTPDETGENFPAVNGRVRAMYRDAFGTDLEDRFARRLVSAAGRFRSELDAERLDSTLSAIVREAAADTAKGSPGIQTLFLETASNVLRALPENRRDAATVRRLVAELSARVQSSRHVQWEPQVIKGENGMPDRTVLTPVSIGGLTPERAQEVLSDPGNVGTVGYLAAATGYDEFARRQAKYAEENAKQANAAAREKIRQAHQTEMERLRQEDRERLLDQRTAAQREIIRYRRELAEGEGY